MYNYLPTWLLFIACLHAVESVAANDVPRLRKVSGESKENVFTYLNSDWTENGSKIYYDAVQNAIIATMPCDPDVYRPPREWYVCKLLNGKEQVKIETRNAVTKEDSFCFGLGTLAFDVLVLERCEKAPVKLLVQAINLYERRKCT